MSDTPKQDVESPAAESLESHAKEEWVRQRDRHIVKDFPRYTIGSLLLVIPLAVIVYISMSNPLREFNETASVITVMNTFIALAMIGIALTVFNYIQRKYARKKLGPYPSDELEPEPEGKAMTVYKIHFWVHASMFLIVGALLLINLLF